MTQGQEFISAFSPKLKWQGLLKAFLLLFVTNENFTAKFSCWRVLICVPTTRGGEKESILKWNVPCPNFSIAAFRSLWVMITSSACGSRSLLTKKFLQRWDEEQMFLFDVPRKSKCKNVKYRLKCCLQALNQNHRLYSLSYVTDSHFLPHLHASLFFFTCLN